MRAIAAYRDVVFHLVFPLSRVFSPNHTFYLPSSNVLWEVLTITFLCIAVLFSLKCHPFSFAFSKRASIPRTTAHFFIYFQSSSETVEQRNQAAMPLISKILIVHPFYNHIPNARLSCRTASTKADTKHNTFIFPPNSN